MLVPLNAVTPSPEICVKCKGRLWCGSKCFILERLERKKTTLQSIKQNEIQSKSPPGVFVSWYGYPKVNFSPMAPAVKLENNDAWVTDDTDLWFGKPADEIINFRESLVRGNMQIEVNQAKDPDYDLTEIHETLMAKKPVDIEMKLKGTPRIRGSSFSDFHAPMGPQAELKKFSMTENPSINPKIDYLYSDTDAKSLDAMLELYKSDVGVNQLHKILSAGMLGVKKNRKLVPTRWSITAVDSQLSEHFIDEKIKFFSEISDYQLFTSNYLENYFWILLLPIPWSFELLEAWKPGASWNLDSKEPTFMHDHELYKGRKNYAENTAGGYYATRIAITEHLLEKKKHASAIVFREIGDAGTPSLGVWKVRETVRDAMKKKPISFDSLDLALKYAEQKLTIPMKFWKKNSFLLNEIKTQKRITDFF
ncbi:MAG: Nre family DNA repair protein [archaeon]|nr:Nre family DNA repair protein [archaeon]